MRPRNCLIHTFCSRYFEVAVWQCTQPSEFRAFIVARKSADGAAVYKNAMECNLAQLVELERLVKTAYAMVEFLTGGGVVEHWVSEPPAPNNPSNN